MQHDGHRRISQTPMTTTDILTYRMHNQQLTKTKFDSPTDVIEWLGAMQSQDFTGAKWGLGQRVPHATDESVEKLFNEGKILRTHVMRPTWHFVYPNDIRWMLQLTGPRVKKVMSSYNKKLELTEEIFKKAQNVFEKVLQGGKQLTRQELKRELTRAGLTTDVQRLAHLVMQAELDSIICSGPRIGKQFTYMLLEERVPKMKALTYEQSLAELTKRYFQSHGPATIKDFVWWSGLTTLDARKGIEMLSQDIHSETIDGKTYWYFALDSVPIPDKIYLLPNYDEYGIAYTEREAFFSPEYLTLLDSRGNATFQHLIIYKGQMIGTWKRTLKKDSVFIETKFFKKPTNAERDSLSQAARNYSKFLNLTLELQ